MVGDTDVGGIAGVNAESGEIRRCESSGNVIGNHSAGGIVGNNHGILNNCSNNGNINMGIQRAIQLSNRLPSLKRVGYNPNWMAIHTVISATISHDTQPMGNSQLTSIRVA